MWMNFPALYTNMLCFVNALVTDHKTCTVTDSYILYLYEGHREEYLSGNYVNIVFSLFI